MANIRIVVGWRHCLDLRSFFVLKFTDRLRPIRTKISTFTLQKCLLGVQQRCHLDA